MKTTTITETYDENGKLVSKTTKTIEDNNSTCVYPNPQAPVAMPYVVKPYADWTYCTDTVTGVEVTY